jgi:small redox-active disulfide protein 2
MLVPPQAKETRSGKNLVSDQQAGHRERPGFHRAMEAIFFRTFPLTNETNDVTMGYAIQILGAGCTKCQAMASVVNQMDATIEKVEDLMDILKFNVMSTPALVIDGIVAVKGRVPTKEEVWALLNP